MTRIWMYTTRYCPFCVRARTLFRCKGVTVEEIAVDGDPQKRSEMCCKTGRNTVPQIFIGERHIGGYIEAADLDRRGELDPLLSDAPRAA